MLSSLSIQCDPVDQPATTDPVEARTWCALRMRIAGRTVTRIWDRTLGEERASLYVPAFPIAEWVVRNWWTLLNEPCRTERVPRATSARFQLSWIKRHCLRSAESGLLLPALYLYNDGRGIRAEWQADSSGDLPNMPGEFVESDTACLPQQEVEESLSLFVRETLDRVHALSDPRVEELTANWRAIQNADADEVRFCAAAGRLGVDPYDPSQMTEDLALFIEQALEDPDLPLARDLTEVAEASGIAAQWAWIQETRRSLKLGPKTNRLPVRQPEGNVSAAQHGYRLAHELRQAADLDPAAPIEHLQDVLRQATGAGVRFEPHNHLSGHSIRSIVGWSNDNEAVVAGPRPSLPESERFHLARALHHSLYSCNLGERLVTNAYTWDQQVSRAFAAELLAPQKALIERTAGRADRSMIQDLAREFVVSTVVVEKQLENVGAVLIPE